MVYSSWAFVYYLFNAPTPTISALVLQLSDRGTGISDILDFTRRPTNQDKNEEMETRLKLHARLNSSGVGTPGLTVSSLVHSGNQLSSDYPHSVIRLG